MRARNRIRLRQVERQAEGYLELGMPQHALDALARLENRADFSAAAYYLRGEAFRAMERYEEGLVPLREAAELAPEDVRVWLAMAWCHKRTGRLDLAIEDLEEALRVEPGEALIHYNLACYLSLAGNKRRALTYLAQALAIDSDYRRLVDDEPDFDPIRSDPEFQALTSIIV